MKKKIIIPHLKVVEQPKKSLKNHILNITHIIIFCVCASLFGIAAGLFDSFIIKTVMLVTDIRVKYPFYFIPFLPLAGLLIYFVFDRFCKENTGSMPLDFSDEKDKKLKIKLRLVPFVTFGTWLTQLCGGSAGTENAVVQAGGTVGSLVSRRLNLKNKNTDKILTITGISAALGGLLGTPIASVFFAVEVISPGYIEVSALLPALIGAVCSEVVSDNITGIEKFTFINEQLPEINVYFIVILCASAILFGIFGGMFTFFYKKTKKLLTSFFPNPYIRIFSVGAVLSISSLFLYSGRYSGTGINIVNVIFNGGESYYWDFIIIFVFSVLTASAGYQGGVFIPLFAIGASLGAAIGTVFNVPAVMFAALGYAAVFGAATNTLLAPIFIGAEIFGYKYIPYFFAVCIISYTFNGGDSIYTARSKMTSPQIMIIKK